MSGPFSLAFSWLLSCTACSLTSWYSLPLTTLCCKLYTEREKWYVGEKLHKISPILSSQHIVYPVNLALKLFIHDITFWTQVREGKPVQWPLLNLTNKNNYDHGPTGLTTWKCHIHRWKQMPPKDFLLTASFVISIFIQIYSMIYIFACSQTKWQWQERGRNGTKAFSKQDPS